MHRFLPTLFKMKAMTVTEIEEVASSEVCGAKPLRSVEPAVRVVLRSAGGAVE